MLLIKRTLSTDPIDPVTIMSILKPDRASETISTLRSEFMGNSLLWSGSSQQVRVRQIFSSELTLIYNI